MCAYSDAVLLMSAEDGLADTVRRRADAAGADVTKVHAVDEVPIAEDGTLRPPTLGDVVGAKSGLTISGNGSTRSAAAPKSVHTGLCGTGGTGCDDTA
jgi:hypothetical protein